MSTDLVQRKIDAKGGSIAFIDVSLLHLSFSSASAPPIQCRPSSFSLSVQSYHRPFLQAKGAERLSSSSPLPLTCAFGRPQRLIRFIYRTSHSLPHLFPCHHPRLIIGHRVSWWLYSQRPWQDLSASWISATGRQTLHRRGLFGYFDEFEEVWVYLWGFRWRLCWECWYGKQVLVAEG